MSSIEHEVPGTTTEETTRAVIFDALRDIALILYGRDRDDLLKIADGALEDIES